MTKVVQKMLNGFDTMSIITVVSLIIGIISVFSAIFFGKRQMEHNKNSIIPICDFVIDNEDKLAVSIANVGTGPLIIKEIVCKNPESSSPTILPLLSPLRTKQSCTTSENVTGRTIPVNGKITLIELRPKNNFDKYVARSELARVTVEVTYTGANRRCDYIESRKLDTFETTLKRDEQEFEIPPIIRK